jgi:uncharacterized membrane protein YebE (DUF533 family)
MKKNVKIAIGVAGLIGAGVVGYFIWKAVQEKNGSGKKSGAQQGTPPHLKKFVLDRSKVQARLRAQIQKAIAEGRITPPQNQ